MKPCKIEFDQGEILRVLFTSLEGDTRIVFVEAFSKKHGKLCLQCSSKEFPIGIIPRLRGFPVEFAILEDSNGIGRILGFNNQSTRLTAVLLNLLFQDSSSDLDTFPFIEDPFSNKNVPLSKSFVSREMQNKVDELEKLFESSDQEDQFA